jgi:hypothetical protein
MSASSPPSSIKNVLARLLGVPAFVRWLPCWLRGRTPREEPQAASLLLRQPVDILLSIKDQLPPESSTAVSLTCKLAFRIFFHTTSGKLDRKSRLNLLLALEPDVSRELYFCHACTQLHYFSSSWVLDSRSKESQCHDGAVKLGDLHVGFNLVRLVMNAHLFGPGRGLSLCQLGVKTDHLPWTSSMTARIIHGQLYVRVSHRVSLPERRYKAFHAMCYHFEHEICEHITTGYSRRNPKDFLFKRPKQIPELESLVDILLTDHESPKDCAAIPGACSFCPTDFDTTIKVRNQDISSDPEVLPVDLLIVSYHQLGHCRSPEDSTWGLFSHKLSYWEQDSVSRARRLGTSFEEGAIRRRWEETTLESV